MLQDAKTETRKPVVFSPIRSSRTAANQILRMMGEGVRRQRKLPFFSETVGINCATVHFCGGRILARQQETNSGRGGASVYGTGNRGNDKRHHPEYRKPSHSRHAPSRPVSPLNPRFPADHTPRRLQRFLNCPSDVRDARTLNRPVVSSISTQ